MVPTFVLTALAAALLLVLWKMYPRQQVKPMPGPKPLPIIGNMLDMPKKDQWKTFQHWAKCYGDLTKISILGSDIILLNSRKAVEDLLEKRSGVYSDRPRSPIFREWAGYDWPLFMLQHNEQMQFQRRLFTQSIGPSQHKIYDGVILESAVNLATRMSHNPSDFVTASNVTTVSLILRFAYGYQVTGKDDKYVQIIQRAEEAISTFGALGTHIIDLFLSLLVLPQWMFGLNFKTQLGIVKEYAKRALFIPYEEARKSMSSNTILRPSIISSLVEENMLEDGTVKNEFQIKAVTGACYSAGFSTMTSTMETFVLAMICYPGVQRKAQAALDKLLKGERLPNLSDKPHLPYLEAIFMEVLRWKPATPLGFPHASSADDMYNGMKVSKGTTIMANTWNIMYNEEDYPSPSTFSPERYLTADESRLSNVIPDPRNAAFGSGRRICPGRYMAEAYIWMNIAMLLTCFNISKPIDDDGNVIEPSQEFEMGVVGGHPAPFQNQFTPRSKTAVEWLAHAQESYKIN